MQDGVMAVLMTAGFAHPETLVDTGWLERSLGTPSVRVIEVDVDTSLYNKGHVPGAVGWNWTTDLQDRVRRDVISREDFESLLSQAAVSPDTTLVLYGDNHNWFAAYAFWLLKLYGHGDVRILDGGRAKWIRERRPLSSSVPYYEPTSYAAREADESIRAKRDLILASVADRERQLVDVRSPEEFSGKILAPEGVEETARRGGHIPGAVNVPWSEALRPDGTFKPAAELRRVFEDANDLDPHEETVTYCRIGERSSHTWFVAKYLLGFDHVRNYDGSWTEYGNLVGVPIER